MMMEQQQKTNEMMMEQQRKANENQARLHEQMAKKDEELAQVQRQLLEVLGKRPEPAQPQHMGPQIVINSCDKDPKYYLSASEREVQRNLQEKMILW